MTFFSKTEGLNYLSDCEFKGMFYPGPGSHETDKNSIMRNHSSNLSMRVPSKGLSKEWRFKKSEKPDVGSYEAEKASQHTSTMKKAPSMAFSKKPNERFTTLYAKSKSFVPGSGNYDPEPCFKRLSRPPSASRRRR